MIPHYDKKPVLVIDDNSQVRDAICDILNMYEIECIMASNGQEGLDTYIGNQSNIGLVLLDLHMPVMGGEETLEALVSLDPEVRVLISSSVSEPMIINRLLDNGALGYLRKPYDVETLLEVVQLSLAGCMEETPTLKESCAFYRHAVSPN